MAQFEFNLEGNIFKLHKRLLLCSYAPDPYKSFYVKDPKLRHIHKASVKDRVLHQAVFQVLYSIFDKHFIFDSYSSRNFKGTYTGNSRVEGFIRKATGNWTRGAWALKCDIKKFFDSIDHKILSSLIGKRVTDRETIGLIKIILESFEKIPGKGLPLGNVTSQLFANIYLNELDQFAKHILKAKFYARYCDDFIVVSEDKEHLVNLIPKIQEFICSQLQLQLHPNKISVRKVRQGIDFLGYVILPHRKVLRTKTKKRVFKKLENDFNPKSISSYKGILSHSRGKTLERKMDEICVKMTKNK